MPTQISIQPESMVDPRGDSRRKPTPLAPRPASLKGKNILLFDNTQLTSQMPGYGPIFRWLSEHLEKEQGAKCSFQSRNLLKEPGAGLIKLADDIKKSGVDGVVVALCNAGITQATSLFANEVEARGIPCVQMTTDLGYSLAGITASNYVPGLPVVMAQPATGDKDVYGKEQTLAVAPEIVAGLTNDPAKLLKSFRERFSAGELGIAKGGKIELPAVTASATEVGGKTTVSLDPSQFDAHFFDALSAADLSDGLPVIAPTEKRVKDMLAFSDLDPDHALVNELPPSGATITVRALAANAVMAGCRPEYFPILVAALQAMADPLYRLFQGAITTYAGGNAVMVSGPLADELGIQSGFGCLGPGYRANATIGRAVNLTIMNVARAIPGKSDLGVFGSPGEFTYCFAESEKNSPWPTLHKELYDAETTTVTVHKCEPPHNVLDPRGGPEDLLRTIAETAVTPGGNTVIYLGHFIVLLAPNQARMIAKAGWTKRDVQEFLFETMRHPIERIMKQGRVTFPPHLLKLPQVPVVRAPKDIFVVVCGGGGGHAMVAVPWGLAQAVTRPVTRKDGSPLKTVKK